MKCNYGEVGEGPPPKENSEGTQDEHGEQEVERFLDLLPRLAANHLPLVLVEVVLRGTVGGSLHFVHCADLTVVLFASEK